MYRTLPASLVLICLVSLSSIAHAAATHTFDVLPGSTGEVVIENLTGAYQRFTFVDEDGDGSAMVDTPILLGSWGVIIKDNGSRIMWCNAISVDPLPGNTYTQIGFDSPGGPDLLTIVYDLKDLIDSGVEFLPDQEVQVADGFIAETPLVQIKDATALVDIMQLGDPAFVESLPFYNGTALFSPVGSTVYGPSSPPPGDYNANNIVDAADYTIWRDTLGSTMDLAADGDNSGSVDPADYDVWKTHFGNTSGLGATGSASASAVPETHGLLSLAALSMVLLLYRLHPCRALPI